MEDPLACRMASVSATSHLVSLANMIIAGWWIKGLKYGGPGSGAMLLIQYRSRFQKEQATPHIVFTSVAEISKKGNGPGSKYCISLQEVL
jgi:hypothetical protein